MIPLFTTLAKSVTGKIVIGLTVATMGVGAAAAAGTELPSLTNAEAAAEESGEQTAEESGEQTAEESGEQTAEESGEQTEEQSDEQTAEESGEQTEEQSDESSEESIAEPTHGDVVSAFTQETDLVGCEKGQATAAVARGDVDPSSPTLTDELAPYLATCGEAGADEDDAEEALAEAQPTDGEEGWKGLRDENKSTWHDAKDAFVAACGDDDDADGDDTGEDAGEDDGDDAELSPECEAMKAELKQLHTDGRTEWHDARDAEHAERKAERAEGKAERAAAKAAKASEKGGSGKGKPDDG
jgi:hypothetical protein